MSKPLVPFTVTLTKAQKEHIAELEEIEESQDKLHAKRATKRTGERDSVKLRQSIELAAEAAALLKRAGDLDEVIGAAERSARGQGALVSLFREQVAAADAAVRERLGAGLLRLAKGETLDLLADLASVHPAALVLLALPPDGRKRLLDALAEFAMEHARITAERDVKHRMAEEIAERDRVHARLSEVAPTEADMQIAKMHENVLRYGTPLGLPGR